MARMSAVGPIDWRPGPGWVHAASGEPLAAEHLQVLGLDGVEGLDAIPSAPAHIEDKPGDKGKREKPVAGRHADRDGHRSGRIRSRKGPVHVLGRALRRPTAGDPGSR